MQECQEDKGFQISCLNCGSKDCSIDPDGDYNYDDEWHWSNTHTITCKNCGQQE
jgi:hypothetical protein